MSDEGKSIALFDFDNVVWNGHSFFPVAKWLVDEKVIGQKVWDDIQAVMKRYKAKEQDYAQTVKDLFVVFGQGLTDLSYDVVQAKVQEYFEKVLPKLKEAHEVWLVTNNSQMVGQSIQNIFGLDGYVSSELEVIDGKFTGKTVNTFAEGKGNIAEFVGRYGGETIAVGDSKNDVEMLRLVKHPVCFKPDDELLAIALKNRWLVVQPEDAEEKIRSLARGFGV
ncbi:MAG: HAD family hydrolase [Patescibacteria group bacterium]